MFPVPPTSDELFPQLEFGLEMVHCYIGVEYELKPGQLFLFLILGTDR